MTASRRRYLGVSEDVPTALMVQRWLMGTMLVSFALRMAFEAKRA